MKKAGEGSGGSKGRRVDEGKRKEAREQQYVIYIEVIDGVVKDPVAGIELWKESTQTYIC